MLSQLGYPWSAGVWASIALRFNLWRQAACREITSVRSSNTGDESLVLRLYLGIRMHSRQAHRELYNPSAHEGAQDVRNRKTFCLQLAPERYSESQNRGASHACLSEGGGVAQKYSGHYSISPPSKHDDASDQLLHKSVFRDPHFVSKMRQG